MEQKKQKLLEKLKELKTQAVYALEGDEPLFAVDTNEMMDLIELAFQVFDAERKPGFTLRRGDGKSVTVETEIVSIQCVRKMEDGSIGSIYNSLSGGTNGDLLVLADIQGKAQNGLLEKIGKGLLEELKEALGDLTDEENKL